ncbi:MAG: hypothetical protein H6R14_580 [Proteobacteria bacterium]|nr:hypothetical protein [Pseudomonadota bacterium]
MFGKFSFVSGVFAIMLFAYAQLQGWNMFDTVANSSHGGSGSSRTYHK